MRTIETVRTNCLRGLESDIPYSVARAAHQGTSFVPEKRGQSECDEYARVMRADFDYLAQFADTEEKLEILEEQFTRYRERRKRRTLDLLYGESRSVSTMIAGPSNFPVARQEKINRANHNKLERLIEHRDKAMKAIERKLCPELRPIMSGDDDAISRLEEKIAEARAEQERMKAVNKAHKKFLTNNASLDASNLGEYEKALIRAYKPNYSWEPHPFQPYQLSNNNANIRRMEQRLAKLKRDKATPETTEKGNGITLEDSPADNRIRLFFPGKPSEEIRTKLKSHGFRWARSLGCWQAYRNWRTIELAKSFVS